MSEMWFKKQVKKTYPQCHAQGSTFNYVMHKGMRSEMFQEWRGILVNKLESHLESHDGYEYVIVTSPNKINVENPQHRYHGMSGK